MNDYSHLARSLAERKAGHTTSSGGLGDLNHYLTTTGGRDAVRGAVDALIANSKLGQPLPQATHQTILQLLMRNMNGVSQ